VLGGTFHNQLTAPAIRIPADAQPEPSPALLRSDPVTGVELLAPIARRAGFPLENPTMLESSSSPDTLPGDEPVRLYSITPGHRAVRLVFHTGGNEFWGIEETDWTGAPILADRSSQRDLGGRRFQLYYSGTHLHMVVLENRGASYWVINTLLNSLSNATMLGIAEGLRPLHVSG